MTNYPILKIPENIENVNSENIPVPGKPTPPIEPYKETKSAWGFLVLLIPLLLIQAYFKTSIETILTTGVVGIIFIIIFSVIFLIQENSIHKANLKSYKKQLENFNTELTKYKERVNGIRNSNDTMKYRKMRIKDEVFKTTLPLSKSSNLNKGYSEDYFYRYLIDRFPNNIYRDIILEDFEFNLPYQPDFLFQDQNTLLHIDIEIDEPYIKQTKRPIHYLKNNSHIDEHRDYFFTSNGWIVIRFAEEQVIKFPESCCDYIAKIIYKLTEKNDWMINDNLDLLPIKAWSYEESLNMMERNFREEYFKDQKVAPVLINNINKPKILLGDPIKNKYDRKRRSNTNEFKFTI